MGVLELDLRRYMCGGVEVPDIWVSSFWTLICSLSLLAHKELSSVWEKVANWMKAISVCLKSLTSFPATRKLSIRRTDGICPGIFFPPALLPSESCYSKYGPQNNSINITWELARNAESQAPSRYTGSESTFLQKSPGDSYAQ